MSLEAEPRCSGAVGGPGPYHLAVSAADPEPGDDGAAWAIVVAAGAGARFGGAKVYAPLGGRRVLDWSLSQARRAAGGVVLVVAAERLDAPEPDADVVVAGGSTRSASVRNGLAAVPEEASLVLVHDAARPLAGVALFTRVKAVLTGPHADRRAAAAIPGIAVTDTLRRAGGGTVDRQDLVAVQTPQAFRAAALRTAHQQGPEGTDDASIVEADGGRVVLVPGDPTNLKITHPTDLVVAEALLDAVGEG